MSAKELPRATLSQLLERAVPYERWRAPLDRKLQMLTLLAGAALVAQLLFLIIVPSLLQSTHSGFFLIGGGILRGLLSWVRAHTPLLMALDLAALAAFLWLIWRTRGLQAGRIPFHQLAFGEAAAGAAGAFPLAASLAVILFNLILWILIVLAGIALLCFLLSTVVSD